MTLPPAPDRWTIELSNAQRMEAVAAFGFTERQARFLLNVLLHSGVFVERQYCAFAGIVHGQKSTDFIKTLVDRRFRANQAFLDLVQVVSRSQVIGERLGRWLSRPGADLNVLLANVRRHGFVRLFATRIHSELGSEAEVEISAGSRNEGEQRHYGLLIRDVGTRLPAPRQRAGQGARLGAATKPVGSAPLRDLVSETVTVIEQHYIETALDLTRGNRKAAAELLGLSRQGLYAKLARYGLDGSNLTDNEPV
jgi:transcriptional regulator PpsR